MVVGEGGVREAKSVVEYIVRGAATRTRWKNGSEMAGNGGKW